MKKQNETINLRLMVFDSAEELGKKVDEHLLEMYNLDKEKNTFLIPIKQNYFEDGHLKVEINETVRGKDMFMLTDIGNYSLEYKMHGFINHTSPNDLMQQLKDGIGACNCHAKSINVVMPLLYAGRQHRRNTRENLACGMMLHELDMMSRVKSFITFDAHDQGVEHAIHNMEFDNFFPTNQILEKMINDLSMNRLKKIVFVAPDNGAVGRRNVYLNSFNSKKITREAGSFYKQRDYNNLVDGKYPIIAHDYSGMKDLDGYTAIVSDDMISSGNSMFDIIEELNKLGVKYIYLATTYALFTKGIDKFEEYYNAGKFNGLYTTNLSYIPEEYKKAKWLHIADCSKLIAQIIYNIHNDQSIDSILKDKSLPVRLVEEKFNREKSE
ncbi:MAG: ribose-phosphate diphosphokinase [Bacilli bacterium]|nr:ribose-phosphate diphosphokinase [Bacilli bacterium]